MKELHFKTRHAFLDSHRLTVTVTPPLYAFARDYYTFEQAVRRVISRVCVGFCSKCTAICCKPDFCQESIDSLWLSLLRTLFEPPTLVYNQSTGWLTPQGCSLKGGRPPVCYDFFCYEITSSIKDIEKRDALNVIGGLVNSIGHRALGAHHLVLLSTPEQLYRLNYKRFSERLKQAYSILHEYSAFLEP